jgi:hypothetical protein
MTCLPIIYRKRNHRYIFFKKLVKLQEKNTYLYSRFDRLICIHHEQGMQGENPGREKLRGQVQTWSLMQRSPLEADGEGGKHLGEMLKGFLLCLLLGLASRSRKGRPSRRHATFLISDFLSVSDTARRPPLRWLLVAHRLTAPPHHRPPPVRHPPTLSNLVCAASPR